MQNQDLAEADTGKQPKVLEVFFLNLMNEIERN